jgi:hypothetical protein
MTMRHEPPASRSGDGVPRVRRIPIRGPIFGYAMAGLLGAAVPLLLSCGSSGTGLIPVQNAGPLQGDFETVAQAAENGNGSCAATETAILKTEQDFRALPSTVDRGLRNRLQEGITRLRSDALSLCKQAPQTTTTDTTPKTSTSTTTTPTTPTAPQTTPTPTTPTTPTTPGPGGGTPAPGEPGSEPDGGTGAGEGSPHGGGAPHGDGGTPGGAGEGGGK